MSNKHLKSSEDLEFFYRRLDDIRLSDVERRKAKAQFARAEAVADLCASLARGIGRLFSAAEKPPRRPAASAG